MVHLFAVADGSQIRGFKLNIFSTLCYNNILVCSFHWLAKQTLSANVWLGNNDFYLRLFKAKIEARLFLKDNESYVFETLWHTIEVKSTELQSA